MFLKYILIKIKIYCFNNMEDPIDSESGDVQNIAKQDQVWEALKNARIRAVEAE